MSRCKRDNHFPPGARIAWLRAAEQDPRVRDGLLDLAKVMGIAADDSGICD